MDSFGNVLTVTNIYEKQQNVSSKAASFYNISSTITAVQELSSDISSNRTNQQGPVLNALMRQSPSPLPEHRYDANSSTTTVVQKFSSDISSNRANQKGPVSNALMREFPSPLPEHGYRSDSRCGNKWPDSQGRPSRCPSEDEAKKVGSCCTNLEDGECVDWSSQNCTTGMRNVVGFRLTGQEQVESLNWKYWTSKFQKKKKTPVPHLTSKKIKTFRRDKSCAFVLGASPGATDIKPHEVQAVHRKCDVFTMNLGALNPIVIPDFVVLEIKRPNARLNWMNIFSDFFENGRNLMARLANATFIMQGGACPLDERGGPCANDVIGAIAHPTRAFYQCYAKHSCTTPAAIRSGTYVGKCLARPCGNSLGTLMHLAGLMGYTEFIFTGFNPEIAYHFYDHWPWLMHYRNIFAPDLKHASSGKSKFGSSVFSYTVAFCRRNALRCVVVNAKVLADAGMKRSSTFCEALGSPPPYCKI